MYSGEYDACDVTLSVYPHRASLKNMPDHGGNRTYDLWNTSTMLCQLSYAVWSVRVCDICSQSYSSLAFRIFRPHGLQTRSDSSEVLTVIGLLIGQGFATVVIVSFACLIKYKILRRYIRYFLYCPVF